MLKDELDLRKDLQRLLFCKGFLITERSDLDLSVYPFYGNWTQTRISSYSVYVHNEAHLYVVDRDGVSYFLIGHAYNPFDMEYDEIAILNHLSNLPRESRDFWEYESKLTGVYVMGIISDKGDICHWGDCAGMRISYYGSINGVYYLSSHSNLIAFLCGLKEDPYITSLKNSRYFKLFGNVLPGDLSAYVDVRRAVPNHVYGKNRAVKRFFPIQPINICVDEDDYQSVLAESSQLLKNTMSLCAKKWGTWNVAISVTGGKDSGVTLASTTGCSEKYTYFSYISKPEEAVDADAAHSICGALGLPHRIITIPDENAAVNDFEIVNEIIMCNGGNIGYIKTNEVRKRCVLINDNSIDIEVKSWVNEVARAYWYKKYNIKHFPRNPSGKYLAVLYKVFLENRILLRKTAKVFEKYKGQYLTKSDISFVGDWPTLWSWEFGHSAGEAQSLFAEHMLSFDITIPFNNRRLMSIMLRPKLQDRINDRLQTDIIRKTALNKQL